jgi:SPOR domain
MTTKNNQPQQDKDKAFGLPQVEFKPTEARERVWLKITASIVGLVMIIGAGFVYWFFYQVPAAYHVSGEAQPIPEARDNTMPEIGVNATGHDEWQKHPSVERNAHISQHAQDLKTLAVEGDMQDFSAPHASKPEKGTITTINTPRGCYYVIVGSFIDDDLASDYAHRLAQKGIKVTLLAPLQGQHYFRVAIKQEATFRQACKQAEALKAVYGTDIWVMKY